ncbi:MAG: sensor histidine kinase, partial [Burkholderiaceae bacterium]
MDDLRVATAKTGKSCFTGRAAIVLAAVGLLLSLQATAQSPPAPEETWRVVVLNNADFLLPASAIMDQALRETLTAEAPRSVEFFGETLDAFRHPGTIDEQLYILLRKKYENIKVDLVMARSRTSMEFIRRYGQELWPDVPVVFYNELPEVWRARGGLPNSTGVLLDLDPAGTIDLGLRLHPQARNIFVIAGTAPYDRGWRRRVEPLLARLKDSHQVVWLDHLPLPQMLDAVKALPSDSIVLYTSVMIDVEGKTRTNPQVAAQVAAASAAPVYGIFETYIGGGIVGGVVADFAAEGREAARLALRVLRGESAAAIPVEPPLPASCMVDARALERFRISEDLLPANCEVRFRAPSVWRDYRWYVFAALAAILLQSLLIATLVVQRKRRKQAELAAHQRSVELAHSLRLATIGEMTAAISHEINQPLTAILSNAEAATLMLKESGPAADQLREILGDIYRDDLRASEVVRRLRSFLQKHDAQMQLLDVNDLVVDTVRLVESEAARRGVRLEALPAPSAALANGDRVQLQQLLINLVINAMDAMSETAEPLRQVTLRASHPDTRTIEIAVVDTGPGIDDEAGPLLFDSF